ncbi:MAG: 16S rRNA (guanine(527)-N(7))-methyltransferase RsmG [Pseudomonadota bacterium]|nr:16S rRNA (guanine(527)-N(7))-methyltransferase RsmG [Pseudomonadota bacterium]
MLDVPLPNFWGKRLAFTPKQFAVAANVSRETLGRLKAYADCLEQQQRIQNLVSRNTLPDLWYRHMLDSIQLVEHIPRNAHSITDLGSGAGFPGLVLAIATGIPTRLIDSNQRKCEFLRHVIDVTGAPATVSAERIEARTGESGKFPVDILTARAVAPLAKLCEMADFLRAGTSLLMKGASWQEELTGVKKRWKMSLETFESRTSQEGRILRIRDLKSI